MKQPEPEDFGLTTKQYEGYTRSENETPFVYIVVVVGVLAAVGVTVGLTTGVSDMLGLLILTCVVLGLIIIPIMNVIYATIHVRWHPLYHKVRQYREAERAYQDAEKAYQTAQREAELARQRTVEQHWMSLSGPQFERELGNVYQRLGYSIQFTPASGDRGVDIFLRKNGKTTIVQCKSHRQPVGPAVARELYGALIASGADEGILACTSGFTRGVRDFARGKPIALISASDLATMGKTVERRQVEQPAQSASPSEAPICPIPGCASRMVRRTGKFGSFWGCSKYPRCKGTRKIH